MRKMICMLFLSLLTPLVVAGNYKSYKVSIYTRAQEVNKMSNSQWLDSTWNVISQQVKVDKIYLETYRDCLLVPAATIEKAKKFFLARGLEVAGGITFTINESNHFETFSYSNQDHRKRVREISEFTAKHFNEFLLDDFFFTNSKTDVEIKAKGSQSWTDYRTHLMMEAGRDLVVNAAKKVNPRVKVIIKYPNWYDHFQGLGFDLKNGPKIFDGIWTGTETRNPSNAQHLQNYLSYNIIRYFENLSPGHNGGGWVDSGGFEMGAYRYAEQLWLTLFAKASDLMLFDYRQLSDPTLLYDGGRACSTTIAGVAGSTLPEIDKLVYLLGNPIGIKSYKPFNSLGDDFLQNYLGMIGLPMDMYPEFPTDKKVVLLTEQAKYDPDIVPKIEAQLKRGGDVVITSSLLKAIPDKLADVAEVRCSDLKAIVNDFGINGKSNKDILIPQVRYQTNDCWDIASAGRPLTGGVSGFPMLLRAAYSKGNMYVMTIPDDMGNLYDLPEGYLNFLRKIMSKDLNIRIEGPSKVSLFIYDNNTFIVESFNDTSVNIKAITTNESHRLINLVNHSIVYPTAENTYGLVIKPHIYQVFKVE